MSAQKIVVIPSELGWIAIAWRQGQVHRLTFGHQDPQAAIGRMPESSTAEVVEARGSLAQLAQRLQAFASGGRNDDFLDVPLDTSTLTDFQRSVIQHCRRIPAGQTCSYGQLASCAGHPGAARAVGRVMADNRWPLIVPCHRVVSSTGLGGFSAPRGLEMKQRLLACESVHRGGLAH